QTVCHSVCNSSGVRSPKRCCAGSATPMSAPPSGTVDTRLSDQASGYRLQATYPADLPSVYASAVRRPVMTMKVKQIATGILAVAAVVAVGSMVTLSGRQGRPSSDPGEWTKPVPKATCGPKDRVETALQGQTTLADRMTGGSERSYNCNLELIGQF